MTGVFYNPNYDTWTQDWETCAGSWAWRRTEMSSSTFPGHYGVHTDDILSLLESAEEERVLDDSSNDFIEGAAGMTPTADEQLSNTNPELQFQRSDTQPDAAYHPLLPHFPAPTSHFLPDLPLPSSPPPSPSLLPPQHQLLPHLLTETEPSPAYTSLLHHDPSYLPQPDPSHLVYPPQPHPSDHYNPYTIPHSRHYSLPPYMQQGCSGVYGGQGYVGSAHLDAGLMSGAEAVNTAGGGMIFSMSNATAHLPGYAEVTGCHGGGLEPRVYSMLPHGLERPPRDNRESFSMSPGGADDMGHDRLSGYPREGQECLVCGDTAACQHYGVRSCEGCKGFFKRSIQRSAKYTCLQNGNCIIDKKRRNRCQHCRFNKCLQVGMVREVVRTESLKGRRGRLSSKAKGTSSDAGLSPSVTLLSMLKSVHESSQPVVRAPLKTDVHGHDQLSDAWSKLLRVLTDSMNILQNEYASHLPGFDKFTEADQRIILQIHGLDLITLRLAYRLFKTSSSLLMESGEVLEEWLFQACGIDYWRGALSELSARLENLLRDDENAFAGMSALTLMNYKTEVDGVHLRNTADSYALHHRLIEVLKSHCCIASPMNNSLHSLTSTSHEQVSNSSPLSGQQQQQQDPTYFSRILAEKEEARRITLELLLRPMATRLDLCPNWLQQAMLMNRVVTVPPPCP